MAGMRWEAIAVGLIVLASMGGGLGLGYLLNNEVQPPSAPSQLASSRSTASCLGYPLGGNCPGSYDYTLTVYVNYSGP